MPVPRRWGHWTLRSRLVVVIVALASVALIAANVAGLVLLRSYLVERVDEQLLRAIRPYTGSPPPDFGPIVPRTSRPPGGGPGQAVLLLRPDGTVLSQTTWPDELSPPSLAGFAELSQRADERHPFTVAAQDGDSNWRVLVERTDGGGLVALAHSLRDVDATSDGLLLIDAAVLLLVVLVLGLTSASMVRIGLRPLTRMETISAEITAGDLSRRVEETDPHTEPGRLGIALNTMLDRIGAEMVARTASEQRLRQFVADASHELRTPLTSIRGFAELYRRGGAPPGPLLDETMGRIEGEAARMGELVEDLLVLARLDLQRPMRHRPVDLLAIAADTIRDAYARVPDRPVKLAAFGPDDGGFEPVTVLGDEHRLRQVATNLVANALRHTPEGTRITVRVGRLPATAARTKPAAVAGAQPEWAAGSESGWAERAGDLAVLEVEDDGPGIPAEHAARIFERLYRVDPSRTRSPGVGSGLGLSIVAAIVQSHGGRVELVTGEGRGSVFRVLLPTGRQPDFPPTGRPHGGTPAEDDRVDDGSCGSQPAPR
ncbi:HAMP domain-containing sensor histidine kinase [Micromonospora polyrhachis]|uniref:histidine kinase n=1 Tax=Micromonospora polyrhachis TaxID=1282883 RepID=A0A7W7WRJ8_9ACTN|nr:ATP-binding protein [Micromonospora polyrhachis]MBB4960632.1 two-component system OmpR family sensor kinase [Micromonospora polyrhachis]